MMPPALAVTREAVRPADLAAVVDAAAGLRSALAALLDAWTSAIRDLPQEDYEAVDLALAAKYPYGGCCGGAGSAMALEEEHAAVGEWAGHVRHLALVSAAGGYVRAVAAQLQAGPDVIAWYLTGRCPECDDHVGESDLWHVVIAGYVVVGCEGYHVVDPNLVGISAPNWQDWTEEQ